MDRHLLLQIELNKLFSQLSIKRFDRQRHTKKMLILSYLKEHSDGVNPSQMAQDLNFGRPHLTRIIEGFENHGLLCRKLSKSDKRRFELFITQEGLDELQRLQNNDEQMAAQLCQFLGAELSDEAILLLQKFNIYAETLMPTAQEDKCLCPNENPADTRNNNGKTE